MSDIISIYMYECDSPETAQWHHELTPQPVCPVWRVSRLWRTPDWDQVDRCSSPPQHRRGWTQLSPCHSWRSLPHRQASGLHRDDGTQGMTHIREILRREGGGAREREGGRGGGEREISELINCKLQTIVRLLNPICQSQQLLIKCNTYQYWIILYNTISWTAQKNFHAHKYTNHKSYHF